MRSFVFDKKNQVNCGCRLGSPAAIGVGEESFLLPPSPFIEYTSNAVYLETERMANIRLHKPLKSAKKIKD
jgi:glucosamine--fructose-6-phosphate aminotransferase (isomerizing)